MKAEIYFPLTVWDKDREAVRQLNEAEFKYRQGVVERLTRKFGAVTLYDVEGTYLRGEKVVMTKSRVIKVYCDDTTENIAFISELAGNIKTKLQQDSVLVTIDKSDQALLL